MPLGIIITELITNSLKYAPIKEKKLQIDIKLQEENNQFQLTYKDNGPGFTDGELKDREGGLGSYLLKNMARQLMGKVSTKNDKGAVSNISFNKKNRIEMIS